MNLLIESYQSQADRWPRSGRVILAQFDEESIVVYQAYRPEIGHYAAKHGRFGNGFSLNRMTWIKPNFLWMMYRSGWGSKEGQEVTLAIRLRRSAFEEILQSAIHSTFNPIVYASEDDWKRKVNSSDVRLQWDPDHGPSGQPLERRAIQLGIRGEAISRFVNDWILQIEDISDFVAEQRVNTARVNWPKLHTPREDIFPITDTELSKHLGVSQHSEQV